MINGVLLLVFPRPDAQTLGTWLTPCFHLPSGNQGKFAWTAQVYDFGYLWVVWGFRTVQIPLAGRHWYSRAQHSRINCENSGQEITSKTNTEPPKCHWLPATGFQRVQNLNPNKIHNASKSCSRQTTICKKHGFSKFDRTWVRKKTYEAYFYGWCDRNLDSEFEVSRWHNSRVCVWYFQVCFLPSLPTGQILDLGQ